MFDDPTGPDRPGNDPANAMEQLQNLMQQAEGLGANVHAVGLDVGDVPFEPDDPESARRWANEPVTVEITAPRHEHASWACMLANLITEHGNVNSHSWFALQMCQEWSSSVNAEAAGVALQIAMSGIDNDELEDRFPEPGTFSLDVAEHEPRNDDATIELSDPDADELEQDVENLRPADDDEDDE